LLLATRGTYGRSGTVTRHSPLANEVGGELDISEITVKAHRGKVMQKMKANSLADLVRMTARLRLAATPKG
jgi:FixJ family two-component response regulator